MPTQFDKKDTKTADIKYSMVFSNSKLIVAFIIILLVLDCKL